ncbi:MAG TPA: hypothetical protein VFJ90_12545, partial [Candidatus Didemnitutus sp.]|nr:hypothetical protein [Candidatus Didemnitutus sp.]
MYDRSSSLVLRWLKVPPAPHAPMGDPASLRVFHAGKNYFNLRLAGWGVAQLLAFAGIVFWVVMFLQIEEGVALRRQGGQTLPHAPGKARNFDEYVKEIATDLQNAVEGKEDGHAPSPAATPVDQNASPAVAPADKDAKPADTAVLAPANKDAKSSAAPTTKPKRPRVRINGWEGFKRLLIDVALLLPLWAFPVLWVLKVLGFLAYLVQIPITYAVRRLDYEMRWYMVTDRSLRIRHGVWRVSESTMSFANI